MLIAVNGWFWGQMTTGSGQYLHYLARYLPQVAPAWSFTLVLPALDEAGGGANAKSAGVAQQQAAGMPFPAGWAVQRVAVPFARLGDNLAKVWFEQVSFPRACRRLQAGIAFTPYWGSSWWHPCHTAVTIHDLIPLLLPEYRRGPLHRLYTRLVSATARRADLVLTDSRASRQDIVRHLGIPGERVSAVLLAADEEYRRVTDQDQLKQVSEKYGLAGGQVDKGEGKLRVQRADREEMPGFFLYLGGFDRRKNVPMIVRAYARFLRQAGFAPNTPRLVIAGKLPPADTDFTPDPRRIVAEEQIEDWVHFTGWVDDIDKPALYSLAAAFIFPSLYEGFGLPVAEAAACGAPVVTSNRSSLPEAASQALLVDPESIAAVADALANIPSTAASGSERRTWLQVAQETARALEVKTS